MIFILPGLFLLGLLAYYGTKQLQRTRKKQTGLAKAYLRLVVQHRLVIDDYEIFGNRVLVFDRKNKKLLVIDHSRSARQETCIPLLSVAETKVVEETCKDGSVAKIFLLLKQKWSDVFYRICFFDRSCDAAEEKPRSARRAVSWKIRIDTHKYPGTVICGQEYVL